MEAATFGIAWCLHLGYNKVILEVDSELLTRWINNLAKHPWSINQPFVKLQNYIKQLEGFKCKHTLREAICVADLLSKYSHILTSPQLYFNINQTPKEVKAYYQLDKQGMASFKRRKMKRIKEPP